MTGANTTQPKHEKPTFSSTHRKDRFLLKGDPNERKPEAREAANEPNRQFVILKDGLPVI